MKKIYLLIAVLLTLHVAQGQTVSPREHFPGLFEAVQLSDIFPDNKTFVDAVPRRDPALIMKDYVAAKDKAGFDLKQFVSDNFIVPDARPTGYKTNISAGIREHLDTLWHVLYRKHDTASHYSSLLALPNDFIIPGGRFRETYYWDSYFTMLGLQESHQTAIIKNMISNFSYLIDKFGFIPNGTRTYYLTRSQPTVFFDDARHTG